jgi:3-oxoacyl-[acyl-carrier-protein] synthase-3
MYKAKITGTGMAVPDCVVDNHLLARCFTTSDEWITQRTGIKERRVLPSTYRFLLRLAEAPDKAAYVREVYDQGVDGQIDATHAADLGREAAEMALKNAGLQIDDIDFIIVTTTIPEYAYPHTGAVMSAKFGLTSTPVLNLQQGCSGFVYALAVADAFIRIGTYQTVLVVGAEALSTMLEYSDRGRDMAVLFADGAGAVVLQSVDASSRSGFISHHLHQDGTILDKLFGEIYGSSTYPIVSKKKIDDGRARPSMNGRAVFTHAVRRFKEVLREALRQRADAGGHRLLPVPPGEPADHRRDRRVRQDPGAQDVQQRAQVREHFGGLGPHLHSRGVHGWADPGGRPGPHGRLWRRVRLGGLALPLVVSPAVPVRQPPGT